MSGDPFFLYARWIYDLLSFINPKDQVGMNIFKWKEGLHSTQNIGETQKDPGGPGSAHSRSALHSFPRRSGEQSLSCQGWRARFDR